MAQLKDEVEDVLAEAGLPFTEEQDDAIILMVADRRQASEELFGGLQDFSAESTQGQEADRMQNEFLAPIALC
ncbi:MAG: hypothetical protein O7G83_08595 [Proteobacteria bacterium]|nr:hypothetical protein [Pseudomonadota bacterium]